MKKKTLLPFLGFTGPLLFFVLVFILLPVAGTIKTSFFQDVEFLEKKFIFLDNYRQIFSEAGFYQSLRFVFFFSIVSVTLETGLGLIMALLLNQPLPFRNLVRASILIPWAIPSAVSARIWELIYNYNYGLANFLARQTGLSETGFNWLGTGTGAFFALVLADTWKTAPFVAIIILAGLQAIPADLYEQARVDGATSLQQFTKITVPLLKPVIVVALLFRTIDALRIFDLVYVLTKGGPGGATSSLSLFGSKYFLMGDFGHGSAVSVVLFILAFLFSLFYVKKGKFAEGIR